MGTQVFGFLTLKVKQRDGLLRGEALNFSNEFSGDLPQERRRGDRLSTVPAKESDQSGAMLELRHVTV